MRVPAHSVVLHARVIANAIPLYKVNLA